MNSSRLARCALILATVATASAVAQDSGLATQGASTAPATSAAAPAPPASEAAARAPLVVVADDDYPPYIFRAADGHVVGVVVDEWAAWSRKTGVRANVVPTDWSLAQAQLAEGRADVIDTVFRSPSREHALDFSDPYATVPVPIYAPREMVGLTDVASLRGLRIGVKAGDACGIHLLDAGAQADSLVALPTDQAIVDAALAGRVQVFCMDRPPARYLLYRAGAADRFNEAFVFYTGELHRAVRKGDARTLELVKRGFAQITPEEHRAIEEKWLGAPLPTTPWAPLLRWASLAVVLAAAAFALWGLAMRRAVREKTALIDGERRRLRTLIDTLPDLVWFKDGQGHLRTCNERFERLVGATEAQIAGRLEKDYLDAATCEQIAQANHRAVESGRPQTLELSLTYANDQHQEVVETLHTAVLDQRGRLEGVLVIARDVTQKRDAERHLRRLNRLYQVLSGVHAAIARERAAGPLFAAVCRIMVEVGDLRMTWVGCPDATSGELVPVAWAGVTGRYLEPPHATLAPGPRGASPSATALREGRAVHSTDVARDPAMAPWRQDAQALGYCSSSAYPLQVHGRTLAVLAMYSGTVEFFDADELELLDRLTSDIGHALETYEVDADRERALADLRDSETRFAQMFKTNPTGMGLGRLSDGVLLDVNDAYAKLFGYRLDEMLGRNGLDLGIWVEPAARTVVMQALQDHGHVHDLNVRFRTRSGEIFHGLFSATRMAIGNEMLALTSVIDVTPQRLATRTLEERKLELEQMVSQRTAELSGILDALPDVYFRMARDGTIVDYRAGRRGDLLEASGQLLGRRVGDALPPQASAPLLAAIEQCFSTAGPVIIEYPMGDTGSGERYDEARLLPFGDDQVIALVRNITDRRSLDAERERARVQAMELATAKSEFLANMSHEIRTPLNGLLGLAQIGLRDSRDTGVRETFSAILRSGGLLLGIVNDVLDFSKIEVGKLSVEMRPMSPRQLIEETVALLRERARAKHIDLTLEIDPGLPAQCAGDPLRTQQVLVNLLSNAIKFTETGGVRARVGVEPAILDLRASDDTIANTHPREIVFRVQDSGIGIEPEHVTRLFSAFQQADTSTTRRFGGTGLGLAISRRLAQLMGGDIRVHSTAGVGSTFELRLPCTEPGVDLELDDADTGWGERPLRRLEGVRVLVAEDNEVNQLVLARALDLEGASTVIVGDGRQAVNRILDDGRGAFDVVLMDIQMPDMDGYEATRRILELAPDLPVIGQTAHAMLDERRECLAAGMVDHIAKPIDFKHLVEMILRHMR